MYMSIKKKLFLCIGFIFIFSLSEASVLKYLPKPDILTRYYKDTEIGYYWVLQPKLHFSYSLSPKIELSFQLESPRYTLSGWESYAESFDSRETPFLQKIYLKEPKTNYNNVLNISEIHLTIEEALPFVNRMIIGDQWINLSPFFVSGVYAFSGITLVKEDDEGGFEYDAFLSYDKVGNYFFIGQFIPYKSSAVIFTIRDVLGYEYADKSKFISKKVRVKDYYAINGNIVYHNKRVSQGLYIFADYTKLYENDYASTVLNKSDNSFYVNGDILKIPYVFNKNIFHIQFDFVPTYMFWNMGIEYTYFGSGIHKTGYAKALLLWQGPDYKEPPNKMYSEYYRASETYDEIKYEKYNGYYDDQQGFDIYLKYKYFNAFWIQSSVHLFKDVSDTSIFNRRYVVETGTGILQGLILRNWIGLEEGGEADDNSATVLYKNEFFNETGIFIKPLKFLSLDVAYRIFRDNKRIEYPDWNESFYVHSNISFDFLPELNLRIIYKYTKYDVKDTTDGEIAYTRGGYYSEGSDYFADNYIEIALQFSTYFQE